jgi:TrmH family RNA methyltransferase
MERISSRQNPLVKQFRELAGGRGDGEAVLLDGQHLVEEALASGVRLDLVAFAEDQLSDRLAALSRQVQAAGARSVSVTQQVLAAISPVRQPSGVVAIAHCPAPSVAAAMARPPQLLLMLHGIQDPGNVGGIIRAAEACGATGVITGGTTADPLGWKALRGSMGSVFRLPVAVKQSLPDVAARARGMGIRLLATVPRGGTPLAETDLRGPCAILLGGEGGGLPESLVSQADERITIPMTPPVESLNVAIAAALILYEASRQRSGRWGMATSTIDSADGRATPDS